MSQISHHSKQPTDLRSIEFLGLQDPDDEHMLKVVEYKTMQPLGREVADHFLEEYVS